MNLSNQIRWIILVPVVLVIWVILTWLGLSLYGRIDNLFYTPEVCESAIDTCDPYTYPIWWPTVSDWMIQGIMTLIAMGTLLSAIKIAPSHRVKTAVITYACGALALLWWGSLIWMSVTIPLLITGMILLFYAQRHYASLREILGSRD